MKDLMNMLQAKYGTVEDVVQKTTEKKGGCEYAIGGPECSNCLGAMNYSGVL